MNIRSFYITIFCILSGGIACTIKAPLITFTQTQTAAEKQMLGEDRNLEKDGWLIASIKTSSSGSEIWERDLVKEEFSGPEDQVRYIALRTLAYLAKELRDYRAMGVLAEGLDGKIRINPKIKEAGMEKVLGDSPTKSRLEELARLVNENREIVIREKLKKNSRSSSKSDEKQIKEALVRTWYRSVEIGEYFEASPGNWKKKD